MILGVLCILIGLSFLSAALLDVASHWDDALGRSIGIAGTLISLLLILAGIAILRQWRMSRALVITSAGCTMVFTAIAGSLHFMGMVAVALGMGFPIALVVGYLRGGRVEHGVPHQFSP